MRAGDESAAAREVELLLGVGPCLYFYAGRVFPRAGGLAFALAASSCSGRNGAASPFDTGGMLRGYIGLHGVSTQDRRIQLLLDRSRIGLELWRSDLARFLATYFDPEGGHSSYWIARPWRNDPDGIFAYRPNEWRAWTFEIRLRSGAEDNPLSLTDVSKWCSRDAELLALQAAFLHGPLDADAKWDQLMNKHLDLAGSSAYATVFESWIREEVRQSPIATPPRCSLTAETDPRSNSPSNPAPLDRAPSHPTSMPRCCSKAASSKSRLP